MAIESARAFREKGQHAQAIAILEKVFAEKRSQPEQALANPDLEAGFVAAHLGTLYLEAGRRENAEEVLLWAKRRLEHAQAPIQDRVLPLATLGEAQRRLGKHREAEATLRRALQMSEGALGANAIETATCLAYLARVQYEVGSAQESIRNHERSYLICEQNFGQASARCATQLLDLAHYARNSNRRKTAYALLSRVKLQSAKLEPGSRQVLLPLLLNELGMLELAASDWSAAAAAFREGLDTARSAQGGEHGDAAKLRIGLGRALAATKSFAEAEAEFQAAIQQLRSESTPRDDLMYEAFRHFASMLKKMGRKPEAAYWAGEAKRMSLAFESNRRGLLTIGLRELQR